MTARCPICRGEGEVLRRLTPDAAAPFVRVVCGTCDGEGRVEALWTCHEDCGTAVSFPDGLCVRCWHATEVWL